MNIRKCFIFILMIVCVLVTRNKAQEANEHDKENLLSPVIYGCDDKILADLIPTLKDVKETNEKMSLKLNSIEKTLMDSTEEKTKLQNISNELLKEITELKNHINNKLKELKDGIRISNQNSLDQSSCSQLSEKLYEFLDQKNQSVTATKTSVYEICGGLDPVRDCTEAMSNIQCPDGIFLLQVPGVDDFKTYCMRDRENRSSAAWTVIQRRKNGVVDFNRKWSEYKNGFGDLMNDFWLGLERMHAMTSQQSYELLIDLEDWSGEKRYAKYEKFAVENGSTGYVLLLGKFSGNVDDSFSSHKNMKFTTIDVDKDTADWGNCAQLYSGGWWYQQCHQSNLNGLYNSIKHGKGINWWSWHGYEYSLKYVQMAIRPRG